MPIEGKDVDLPAATTVRRVPEVQVKIVARNLLIPWAMAFAPDGRMFFTERVGRVRVLQNGRVRTFLRLPVVVRGEGGLMGLALHPDFAAEPYVYVMYTALRDGVAANRISRFRETDGSPGPEEVLFDGIPAAQYHDGGALAFGPDGMLYAGTGDARLPDLAQDLDSPAGKILRFTPTGGVPPDNPFPGSPIWAYGFRNVSALAWRPGTGELWAASHGPSGEFINLFFRDSVYIVRRGGNHGWPLLVGRSNDPDIVSPVIYYREEAIPPGGVLFYTGKALPQLQNHFLIASLRSEHLQNITVGANDSITAIERWWQGRYGRLRGLAQGPDGALYVSTSNRDGRGRRRNGHDVILRITPR